MGMIENKIDQILKGELEEQTLEEFLEQYDLTPTEVVTHLYRSGLVDLSEKLEELEVT